MVKYGSADINGKTVPLTGVSSTGQTVTKIQGPVQTWTKYSFNIDPKVYTLMADFKLEIIGSISTQGDFIAVDDVVLAVGACRTTPVTNLFFCKGTGTQYSASQRCNFVYDCPQKDDEANCGNCDFETDTCNWGNGVSMGEQWKRKMAGDKMAPVGPLTDGHGSTTGHYMIVDPNVPVHARAEFVSNRTVVANEMKSTYYTCHMSFKYYMIGRPGSHDSAYFGVSVNGMAYNPLWRSLVHTTNAWTTATVAVGEHNNVFYMDISGADSGTASTLVIDDIQFQSDCYRPPVTTSQYCPSGQIKCPTTKICINQFSLCDQVNDCGDQWDESYTNCAKMTVPRCSFESQVAASGCNYTLEKDSGSTTNWAPLKAATAGINSNMARMTGPMTDHTYRLANLGTFMTLQAKQPKDYGKKARLVSRVVTAVSGQTCALRLHYYMFGNASQMASLRLYVRYADYRIQSTVPAQVFKGDLGQEWHRAIIGNADTRPFQFVIEGQIGSGPQSDIAIDDMMYSEGCAVSNAIPVTTTTTSHTSNPTVKPTHSGLTQNNEPKKSKAGPIAAGVLVPICIIGAILGFLYYRRYRQQRGDDDRSGLTSQVHYNNHDDSVSVSH